MIETGTVALKLAGRKAGRACVIVEKPSGNFVIVDDGNKRKRSNISHLELTQKKVKHSSSAEIAESLRNLGFKIPEKKDKNAADKKPTEPVKTIKTKK